MATVDEAFLMHLLQACAATSPLYPAWFAQQENLERDKLDASLDELRRRGLLQFTEWVKGAGQGYAVTDAGRRALTANRLPTVRAVGDAGDRSANGGIGLYDRGEIVRSAVLAPGRPYACWTLLVLNLLFFGAGAAYTSIENASILEYLKGEAVRREGNVEVPILFDLGGLWTPVTVPQGVMHERPAEFYRLLLFLFIHAGLLHLFMNMYVLATMAGEIEAIWGSARFLAIYFAAGLVSGCVVVLINRFEGFYPVTVGASGPLFGVFMAMIVWFWFNREHLPVELVQEWSRVIAVGSLLLLASNFLPNVSWQGHLGGAIGGLLAALLLQVQRFHPSRFIRWLALAGVPMIPMGFFLAVLWQAKWF